MSAVKLSSEEPFVYSIFGLQLPDGEESSEKKTLKEELHSLITPHATYIDLFVQDGCASTSKGKTLIWLGYWKSHAAYLAWWASIWREIMSPDSSRTQYMTNKSEPVGLGHLGTEVSVGDKTGYWGCYRHRMAAHSKDDFASPIQRHLEVSQHMPGSPGGNQIGRVLMTKFPDNILFVVEGQDHSNITADEKEYWNDNLDSNVTQWMKALFSAGPDSGILGSRMCYAPETGVFRDSTPKALNYNKKAQLFYFKDLQHMERMGRTNKGHAALRSHFMRAYSPKGPMESGKLVLWVETTVLKNGEIECEYVGCEKGTGWMALAGQQEFW
ncbi:unnamed protein product [Penicillium manginii]